MKLFKAMKKLAKLKGEMLDIKTRIQNNISTNVENEYEEMYSELDAEYNRKMVELIDLKNKVMKTNIEGGKYEIILLIGELKSQISFYKELPIRNGVVSEGWRHSSEGSIKYKTQLTDKTRNAIIREIQDKLERAMEELDNFNAITSVIGIE